MLLSSILTSCTLSSSTESSVVPIANLSSTSIVLGETLQAGSDVTVSGNTATITKAGTYRITGTSDDSQIVVDTEDKWVILELAGVTLTSDMSAPIFIKNGSDAHIVLVAGTTNTLTDASKYTYATADEDEPNATIFSKDDLYIEGDGTLIVNGVSNDGIASKNTLQIDGGNITVNAKDDGIRGKEELIVNAGTIAITSEWDAMKSDEENLGNITINGGTITINAWDDGIHAENLLTVNNGTIDIVKSYEGLEWSGITINNGTINLTSSDDGINVAGASTETEWQMGPMGNPNATNTLTINGGKITLSISGDGLDANGQIIMTGGDVIVYGPTNNGNGALDYDGTFQISGGSLIAVGSAGMAMQPSASSTQNSVLIGFSASQSAGTVVKIVDSNGATIMTITPPKVFQSLAFSSPLLVKWQKYQVYTDDTLFQEFTVSWATNTVGTISQMGGMGGGRGMMGSGAMMGGSGMTRGPRSGSGRMMPPAGQMGSGMVTPPDGMPPPEGMEPPTDIQ